MIKLKAFLLSLVLVIATLALLNVTYVKKIDDYYKVKDNSIRYSTSYEKYKSRDILTNNITPNTLVLMGSSELVATINEDYHPNKIFNYNDFNIMQIGTSYSQNIIQATTLSSIEGAMSKRKSSHRRVCSMVRKGWDSSRRLLKQGLSGTYFSHAR